MIMSLRLRGERRGVYSREKARVGSMGWNKLHEKANQARIISRIQEERDAQDKKWGEQNHDFFVWLAILMEEVGEASKAALERKESEYESEMIQVAAVAVAALECLQRGRIKEESELADSNYILRNIEDCSDKIEFDDGMDEESEGERDRN
jgi:NTP pyrophosphatase (non-canonical NTP hydrolase)